MVISKSPYPSVEIPELDIPTLLFEEPRHGNFPNKQFLLEEFWGDIDDVVSHCIGIGNSLPRMFYPLFL